MARSPVTDPQPGDVVSLGGALRRRVVAVEVGRVAWTLEAGPDPGRIRSCSLDHWRRTFGERRPWHSDEALDGWDRRVEKARRGVA
jgi:hypothetical protein